MTGWGAALLSAGIVLAIGFPFVLGRHSGERGLATTVDAQEFDQLWRDLQSLHDGATELAPAEFKARAVRRTADFLELDPDQRLRFVEVVDLALTGLEDARARMERVDLATSGAETPESITTRQDAWHRWRAEQRSASDRLMDALESSSPRHWLLAEKRLLWLLRLDYGTQQELGSGRCGGS